MLTRQQLNKKLMSELPKVAVTHDGKLDFVDLEITKKEACPKDSKMMWAVMLAPQGALIVLILLTSLFFGREGAIYVGVAGLIACVVGIVLTILNKQYLTISASTITSFAPVIANWLKTEYNLNVAGNKIENMTSSMLTDNTYIYTADKKQYLIARTADDSKKWEVKSITFVPGQHQYASLTPNSTQQSS